jgi:hypothetical protein
MVAEFASIQTEMHPRTEFLRIQLRLWPQRHRRGPQTVFCARILPSSALTHFEERYTFQDSWNIADKATLL